MKKRSEEHFTEDIIAGLKWLGLNWDEGPDIGGPLCPLTNKRKRKIIIPILLIS